MNERGCSIGELARLSGVSTRTLRHYESIGLLHPSRDANDYRLYSGADAKRLTQIQAMKLCGLPLATIKRLLSADEVNIRSTLVDHLDHLRAQGDSLSEAMRRTEAAIAAIERLDGMATKDALQELKEKGLREFEKNYGDEARKRYGNDAIEAANARMMALTQDEWDAKELLEEAIKVQLRLAMASKDPASAESEELVRMHERWIAMHWGQGYGDEEYLGMVRGYQADPRFVEYYDSAAGEGATEFLIEAVEACRNSRDKG